MNIDRERLLAEIVALSGSPRVRAIYEKQTDKELVATAERYRRYQTGIREHGRIGFGAVLDGQEGFPKIVKG